MNQDDALALCEQIRNLIGDGPGGGEEREKAAVLANKLIAAATWSVPKEHAVSLREQLGRWLSNRQLTTYQAIQQCKAIIEQDLDALESHWDRSEDPQ